MKAKFRSDRPGAHVVKPGLVRRIEGLCREIQRDPRAIATWREVAAYLVAHPRHALRWLYCSVSQAKPIELGLPYLSWPCVDFLRERVRAGMSVLEYGGGGSTIFFARLGCNVTTVEGHEGWANALRDALAREGAASRTDIRLVPTADESEETRDRYARQVHAGGPWDVVLVDGAFRLDCLREAVGELRDGGMIVFDNADFAMYQDVPHILRTFQRRMFRGLGVGRRRITQTDVYERDIGGEPSSATPP